MSLVQDLTPTNLQEEKQKFFDKDCKYNPQFKYKTLVTLDKLYKYRKPKEEYLKLAKKIVKKAFHNRTEEDIRSQEGEKINQKQAKKMIDEFLKKNDLTKKIKVKWSKNFLGKASFFKDTLKLKLPLWHRKYEFTATLYHELGTHAIRRFNYIQQPFYKKKKQFQFKDYLKTEEGLAGFHSLLGRKFKLDYSGALNYVTSETAQNTSFIGTFNFISQYINDPNRAWRYVVKHKRGLYDTSKEGGFTKDLVYFEGLIKIWRYFQKTNFDLISLYWGKIAAEDIEKAKEMNPDFKPQLPHFYTQNPDQYQQEITAIAQKNLLHTL